MEDKPVDRGLDIYSAHMTARQLSDTLFTASVRLRYHDHDPVWQLDDAVNHYTRLTAELTALGLIGGSDV